MKNLIANLLVLIVSSVGIAESQDRVSKQVVDLGGGRGVVEVNVVKQSVELGRPYTIQLYTNCGNNRVLLDADSVCDAAVGSAKLSSDGKAIEMVVRETDEGAYNAVSRSADPETLGTYLPPCRKKPKVRRYSIENACK